jgi:hypothetical protein
MHSCLCSKQAGSNKDRTEALRARDRRRSSDERVVHIIRVCVVEIDARDAGEKMERCLNLCCCLRAET